MPHTNPKIPLKIKILIAKFKIFSIIKVVPKFVNECRQSNSNCNPENNPNNFKGRKQTWS